MDSPCNEKQSEHLLARIHSPADVKALPEESLPKLASEIRELLVNTLSNTGGHLAPNLGVVELSIALHRVFETPRDKILFDVSHQSYIHKILTGRAERLNTIRQFGGLSGFTKRSESAHDAYGAGHAGTALSAALGMAAARDLSGENYHVVAVAGDGAFTCGTTLEALNSIASTTRRFIVVLNDNEWSIDKNVGALSRYFSSLQETQAYTWLKERANYFLQNLAGDKMREQAVRLMTAARSLISPLSFFRELGLTYYGPIDGHNIRRLERVLRLISRHNEPAILHIITRKGMGYEPAMQNPTKFHGIGKYNVESGETGRGARTYSEVFGTCLANMADADDKILALTAAMPSGTKLDIFRQRHPKRFFDTGIAEEHAAIFSCGLATQGYKPYLAIYSTFMQRCVDMIEHDAALQSLPVRFCMDRAGLSPDDGPTHHGLFDIAMMRAIPNLVMMQPKDEAELCHMLVTMNGINDRPSVIRYPRGEGEGVPLPDQPQPLPLGRAEVLHDDPDAPVALIALGNMNSLATQVRELLSQHGVQAVHINARFIKPLDEDLLLCQARAGRLLVTLEDHVVAGGFGSAVSELMQRERAVANVLCIGWPDAFVEHGKLHQLRELHGLTPSAVCNRILQRLQSLTPAAS